MKTSSKFLFITVFSLIGWALISIYPAYAQTDVNINAEVDSDYIDYYRDNSYFTLEPAVAGQAQPVTVIIYLRGLNYVPVPGFYVYININPTISCSVTQPSSPTDVDGIAIGYITCTNPGTYDVSIDVTSPYTFTLAYTDSFSVNQIVAPVMQPEPAETYGATNTVYWSAGTGCNNYFVQAARDISFSDIVADSGYITGTSYTFSGLAIDTRYYYRVMCRNAFNYDSDWSNTVNSLQVFPISPPTLQEEPEFTIGDQNTIYINPGMGCSSYYLEISTDSDFSEILTSSGYILTEFYTFFDLTIGYEYFYRAKCKGPYGNESTWSNTVNSTQVYEDIYLYLESVTYDNNGRITVTVDAFWDGISSAVLLVSKDGGPFVSWGLISGTENVYDLNEIWGSNKDLWYGVYSFKVQYTTTTTAEGESDQRILEIRKETPITEPVTDFFKEGYEVLVDFVNNIQTFFKSTPDSIRNTVVVGAYALTATNIYLLWQFLNVPYFLQLLMNLFNLIGFTKRPQKQGVVYDSITKQPLARVIVRVFNKDHKLLSTAVTDSRGIFYFKKVDEQVQYHASLKGYSFPSDIVLVDNDFPYTNVYTHSSYKQFEKYDSEVSIPLDPVQYNIQNRFLRKLFMMINNIFVKLNTLIVISGFLFSSFVLLVSPVWYNYILWGLSVMFLGFKLLELTMPSYKRRSVVVLSNGSPVSGITVELIDREFSQVIDRRITNDSGEFLFWVKRGSYRLTVDSAHHEIVASDTEDGILVNNRSAKEKVIKVRIVVAEK